MRRRLELGDNARMALETLRDHKTRSLLTVLGVVIGIIALIGVASIMVGMDRQIRDYLNDYGANTVFIFKWNPGIHPSGRLSPEERNRKVLTVDDADAAVVGGAVEGAVAEWLALLPQDATRTAAVSDVASHPRIVTTLRFGDGAPVASRRSIFFDDYGPSRASAEA